MVTALSDCWWERGQRGSLTGGLDNALDGRRDGFRWQVLLLTGLGASVLGIAWLLGNGAAGAGRAAGAMVSGVAVLQMLWDLLTPVLVRARLRRDVLPIGARLRWSALVRGAASVAPVILPRLARAVTEVGAGGSVGPRLVGGTGRDPDPARVALLGWITAELRRRGWQAPALVLGRALGSPARPGG